MKAYQNLYITGSIDVTGSGITGSLYGTASYTSTASYVNILTQPVTISGSVQISGSLLINGEAAGTGGGTTVIISGSAPSGSSTGSMWFNNNDLNLYVRYYDGTSSYWAPSYNNRSLYANSASFATSASLAQTASLADSASVSVTASYAASLTGSLRQNLTLSGSILISGSLLVNGVAPGAGGGGATVTITGSTPSGSKDSGSLWFNSTDNNLYIQTAAPTGSTYLPAMSTVSASFATSASYLDGALPTLVQAENTSGQSIANNPSPVPIVTGWTNIYTQSAAEWNATTGVFTATKAGTYLVSSNLTYAAKAAGQTANQVRVQIFKNSTSIAASVMAATNTTTVVKGTGTATSVVNVAVGDTITIRTFHDLGSAALLNTTSGWNNVTIQEIPSRITR